MKSSTDVVVVGGGPAGLAAAVLLARGGARVSVFERSSSLGGRAATQDRHGFLFNRGAHALYTGGAASETLAELGVAYSFARPKAVFARLDGQLYPVPLTARSLLSSHLLDRRDKLAMIGVFAGLPRLDPRAFADVTARQWLDRTASRPRVRLLLEGFARTYAYSSALDLVSAELVIARFQQSLKYPVHYIEGGWQTLVDGLERAATRAGARIERGAAATSLEFNGNRATAVLLRDGRRAAADAVVVATTPAEAARLLPPLQPIVERLKAAEVACLDVALRTLPIPGRPVVQDLDGPRFLTTQSTYVKIAPPGGALVQVFKQLDPRQTRDPAADERELETLLDAIQPGWRDVLVDRVFLPRMQGAGALPLAESGGLMGRPGSRLPDLANAFVAGDWVGPEGYLLDTALASAREAARLALATFEHELPVPGARRLLAVA